MCSSLPLATTDCADDMMGCNKALSRRCHTNRNTGSSKPSKRAQVSASDQQPASQEEERNQELLVVLRQQEGASIPSQDYTQQLYIGENPAASLRSSLVDWMIDVSQELNLSNDVAFLGVQLLDKYLQSVLRGGASAAAAFSQSTQLQLTGMTALWVAAKYEGAPVPAASAFLQQLPYDLPVSEKRQQLLAAEQVLLTALDHRLACPTPKSFLRRCMSSLCDANALDKRVYFTAGYLAELSLLDAGMLCYKPSEVAASSYAWALAVTGTTCTGAHLKQHTGYDLAQIMSCMQRLARVHTAACNTSRPCMISLKYLAGELGQVAALPPVGYEQTVVKDQKITRKRHARASSSASSTDLNNSVVA